MALAGLGQEGRSEDEAGAHDGQREVRDTSNNVYEQNGDAKGCPAADLEPLLQEVDELLEERRDGDRDARANGPQEVPERQVQPTVNAEKGLPVPRSQGRESRRRTADDPRNRYERARVHVRNESVREEHGGSQAGQLLSVEGFPLGEEVLQEPAAAFLLPPRAAEADPTHAVRLERGAAGPRPRAAHLPCLPNVPISVLQRPPQCSRGPGKR
mmetsp:Transcript_12757/g.33038  ORF Transcript_12757/g.33038 Transcript_12757/m.33038 type:complete len:213 (-) Transcript_12757:177-815(-)